MRRRSTDSVSEDLLLGIDIGTYSSKGVLCDLDGTVVASASTPNTVDFPQPGYAEQDPEGVWWTGFRDVTRELFRKLDGSRSAKDIVAVGVSAIGPCMVPMDSAGRHLRAGILYGIDTRAIRQIERIESELGEDRIIASSRMNLSSQAVGPKIAWFREQEPYLYRRTRQIGTATTYLIQRLTGRFVIDHHQAAHFIPLYDPAGERWSDRYAEGICDLDRLPELGWPTDVAGTVTAEAARQTGIPSETPVVFGTVDALSEAVSVAAVNSGDMMVMYGSTGFFILTTDSPVVRPPLWSLPGLARGSFVLAAGMATTGAMTRWLAELFSDSGVTKQGQLQMRYDELFRDRGECPVWLRRATGIALFFRRKNSDQRPPGSRPHRWSVPLPYQSPRV